MRAPLLTEKRARSLRRAMTPPETALWTRLRARREGLPSFRRQHPIGPYILDFYCARLHLAIEVDGLIHGTGQTPVHDDRRDAWLRSQGIEVIRFTAADVLKDADAVAHSIWTLVLYRTR
ncbi:endonuclease domain-containing protein [Brevundimonas sp. NPDC090276]|uniref:endonuclease domain-containing protein n=1 Tax=Brevundimonas sp. NPDC090276 TaxID=3363956 RepID=UPI00383BA5AB